MKGGESEKLKRYLVQENSIKSSKLSAEKAKEIGMSKEESKVELIYTGQTD